MTQDFLGARQRGTTTPTKAQKLSSLKRDLRQAKSEMEYYMKLCAQYDKEIEELKNESDTASNDI